jgi:hypothetical protein
MAKKNTTAADQILTQVTDYCQKYLDNEYEEVCNQVFKNLLEENPAVFNRGNAGIWGAAIIWAVGSINFLGDKSFKPYATLADVCSYFNANKSSVGQKSAKIRKLLNINRYNPDYQTTNAVSDFLNSLVMTPEGFIASVDMFEVESEMNEIEEPEDDEPMEYLLVLNSSRSVSNATLYQLEHLIKTTISKESKLIEIEKQHIKTVLITFYGTQMDIELLNSKLRFSDFEIVNIYCEDQENDKW